MRELFIESDAFEVRAAVREQGRLTWLERESHQDPSRVGAIYHGKVRRVVPGMDCAFVDIGLDRDAFLQLGDLGERGEDVADLIAPGERMLVQVVRDRRGKGPRVTTRVAIAGRLLVLLPLADGVAWSRKIAGTESWRDDVEQALAQAPLGAYGWIVRTAGADAPGSEFTTEADLLVAEWDRIMVDYRQSKHPRQLYAELDLARRMLRDLGRFDRVVVHGPAAERVLAWMSERGATGTEVRVDEQETSLYARSGLDKEIERLQKPWVRLPSGGSLVIESTEALVSIDVNSGSDVDNGGIEETALATNLEAADEIALQMRARGLGGLIVIDFIDMRRRENRAGVLERLREAVVGDPQKVQVGGMSRFGLVDLTRRQAHNSYFEQSLRSCPVCGGRGKVASIGSLRSQIRHHLAGLDAGEEVDLHLAPETAERLGGLDELVPRGVTPPRVVADDEVAPSELVWRGR